MCSYFIVRTMENTYECAMCGGTFPKGDKQVAKEEFEKIFEAPLEKNIQDMVLICGLCYSLIDLENNPKEVEETKKHLKR